MGPKRTATDKLNVALAGIEAFLDVVEPGQPVGETALKMARIHAEDARNELSAIMNTLAQLR